MRRSAARLALAAACSILLAACARPSWVALSRLPWPVGDRPTAATPDLDRPSESSPTPPPSGAITVNGVAVASDECEALAARAAAHRSSRPDADGEVGHLYRECLEAVVDGALIDQAAELLGFAVSEEAVDERVAAMRGDEPDAFADWMAANGLTEGALRARVRREMAAAAVRDSVTALVPRRQRQVRVRHILLRDEREAAASLARLAGGEDWSAVAAAMSRDASTRHVGGGDLGYLPRGVLPTAVEDVAFDLAPGEASGAITCETGVYIVQVLAVDADRPVPGEYWPAVQQHAFESWLDRQRAAADIVLPYDHP